MVSAEEEAAAADADGCEEEGVVMVWMSLLRGSCTATLMLFLHVCGRLDYGNGSVLKSSPTSSERYRESPVLFVGHQSMPIETNFVVKQLEALERDQSRLSTMPGEDGALDAVS